MKKIILIQILFIFIFTTGLAQSADPDQGGNKINSKVYANELSQASTSNQLVVDPSSVYSIDQSGNLNLSLKVFEIESRNLKIPITLSYQSGIKPSQKSSEVGLGWQINFGSIKRDFGAFEPDYTSTSSEFKMIDKYFGGQAGTGSTAPGELIGGNTNFSFPGSRTVPFFNGNSLVYDKVKDNSFAPDKYYVTCPGLPSDYFWNQGAIDATHEFGFSKNHEFKLEYSSKVFSIPQEISRINELNFNSLPNPEKFTQTDNYAAAICTPPYVVDKAYTELLNNLNLGTFSSTDLYNGTVTINGETKKRSIVEYRDFDKFEIVNSEGVHFVFGRPLRGQKYLMEESPYWSTNTFNAFNNTLANESQACFGELWKIDYISEWLLTEIKSADYVDIGNDGMNDLDLGDWIKFTYTEPIKSEDQFNGQFPCHVPMHREFSNFSQTDKASSLIQERAYLVQIETPLQKIDLTNSTRFDIDFDYFNKPFNRVNSDYKYAEDQFNGTIYKNSINYPIELRKYDKIIITPKLNDLSFNTAVMKEIEFEYAPIGASQLCHSSKAIISSSGIHSSYVPTDVGDSTKFFHSSEEVRGKTTLLGLNFKPNSSTTENKRFEFEYGYNPDFTAYHKKEVHRMANYPNIRQSPRSSVNRGFAFSTDNNLTRYKIAEVDGFEAGTIVWTIPSHITIAGISVPNWANQIMPIQQSGAKRNSVIVNEKNRGTYFEDEQGFFHDPTNTSTMGKAAWSLTSIKFPTGGKVDFEYEQDEVALLEDRELAFQGKTIHDGNLPSIGHYNFISLMRSLGQEKLNTLANTCDEENKKKMYRNFIMALNPNSGGIRVKKIITKFDFGSNIVKELTYGKGHFTAVPTDYWNKNLSAFGAFLQKESNRHAFTDIYHPDLLAVVGFTFNEYANSMLRLFINTRVIGNSEHYYEHIVETNMMNDKIKRFYGGAITKEVKYNDQFVASVKQYGVDRSKMVDVIVNVEDNSNPIVNYKTEYINSNNDLIKTEELDFSFEQINETKIETNQAEAVSEEYPYWFCQNEPSPTNDVLLQLANQTDHNAATTLKGIWAFANILLIPGPASIGYGPFADPNNNIGFLTTFSNFYSANASANAFKDTPRFFKDDPYIVPASNFRTHQSYNFNLKKRIVKTYY